MTRDVRVVAEIGQAKGDISYAYKAVAAAAAAGCWGVKLQLLQPERIAQADASTYWDERRPDIADQRANFARTGCLPYDPEVLIPLVLRAREMGVELFASPFDPDAVHVMLMSGMRWCKIASGDITNEELVRLAAATFPQRLILATGAATAAEIDQAVEWIYHQSGKPPAYLLACSLVYPSPDGVAEIARVATIAHRHYRTVGTGVGYSDHTFGIISAAVAVGAGATMLEKHVTLDASDLDVPDNAFAIEPDDLELYVNMARRAADMMGTGLLMPTGAERLAHVGARRSLCAARDLPAGHVVRAADLVPLRPARPDAFAADLAGRLLGRELAEPVAAGCAIPRRAVRS